MIIPIKEDRKKYVREREGGNGGTPIVEKDESVFTGCVRSCCKTIVTGVKEKGQPFSTKLSGLDRIARRWNDLDVPRLDGAAEELGGHALGEVDIHVHLLQRLVPLEHLLPCAPRSMAGWRREVPNPWSEREGDPEEKAGRGREGCRGSPLWTKAWRFSAMDAGRSGSRGASERLVFPTRPARWFGQNGGGSRERRGATRRPRGRVGDDAEGVGWAGLGLLFWVLEETHATLDQSKPHCDSYQHFHLT
jgi:hypothetical protein